jgi:hypothetical protein
LNKFDGDGFHRLCTEPEGTVLTPIINGKERKWVFLVMINTVSSVVRNQDF